MEKSIAGLYRAAAGVEPWSKALHRVTNRYRGLGTQFICINKGTGALTFSLTCESIPPEVELEYVRQYHALDARLPLLLASSKGEWIFCQDELPEDVAEESPHYRDLQIPYGARYSAMMKVAENADETVLIVLLSHHGQGPFDEAQRAYIKSIGFHLREAFQIFRSVREHAKEWLVSAGLIQRIRKPVFIFSVDRHVSAMNDAATALVNLGDGPLRVHSNRIHAADAETEQALTVESLRIAKGLAPAKCDQFIPLPQQWRGDWLALSMGFLPPAETTKSFGDIGHLLLTVHPRAAPGSADPVIWRRAFGLTPAEARVAGMIHSGRDVKQAALKLGVAQSTVKSQLKSVYAKTATSRQSELVGLLAGLRGDYGS